MPLSRWRRVMTGFAAGVIVLCAALVGGSLRNDGREVAVVTNERPENVIAIPEDPEDPEALGDTDDRGDRRNGSDVDAAADSEAADDEPTGDRDEQETEDQEPEATDAANAGSRAAADDDPDDQEPEPADDDPDDQGPDGSNSDPSAAADENPDDEPAEAAAATDSAAPADPDDEATADLTVEEERPEPEQSVESEEEEPEPEPEPTVEPEEELGLGGGLDGAECALDRLVVYAGNLAPDSASRIRDALVAAEFGTECTPPVEVLASNCPLQFDGVLESDAGYDPTRSYVAAGASVNRATMIAIMGAVGYTGNAIDILDFGFGADGQSGQNWMAVFVPPSLQDWEPLAEYAGLSPTVESYCLPSGELAG